MSFISSFEIIKVVVPEQCIFFAKGIATLLIANGPANLLNNYPKNPPD